MLSTIHRNAFVTPFTATSGSAPTRITSAPEAGVPTDSFVSSGSDDSLAGTYSPRMFAQRFGTGTGAGNSGFAELTAHPTSEGRGGTPRAHGRAHGRTATAPGSVMGTAIRRDYDDSLRTDGSQPLNTRDYSTRLGDLEHIAQLDSNGTTAGDEDRCGAASITAGAYYLGGTGSTGLSGLVSATDAYRESHHLGESTFSPELRARLRSGTLTRDDVNQIQAGLHTVLARQQHTGEGVGITGATMSGFLSESGLQSRFDAHGLSIGNVDSDGDGTGNHFVLAGNDASGSFVYDPYPIRGADGDLDQVTRDRVTRASYIRASQWGAAD